MKWSISFVISGGNNRIVVLSPRKIWLSKRSSRTLLIFSGSGSQHHHVLPHPCHPLLPFLQVPSHLKRCLPMPLLITSSTRCRCTCQVVAPKVVPSIFSLNAYEYFNGEAVGSYLLPRYEIGPGPAPLVSENLPSFRIDCISSRISGNLVAEIRSCCKNPLSGTIIPATPGSPDNHRQRLLSRALSPPPPNR